MKYLNFSVLLLTTSSTFASERLPCEDLLNGTKTLALSHFGQVGYSHSPYRHPTGAREIKRIAERVATAFQSNIPREFPILLKLLESVLPVDERDSSTIETTKNYITKTVLQYQPRTAIDLCKITSPTNGEEQTVAIRQLQASLHVLSNIKATLFEDDTEYNQTVDIVYDAITKFAHAEYFRLQKCHHSTPDTMTQYDQIIVFFETIDLSLFEEKKAEIIKCYHITML